MSAEFAITLTGLVVALVALAAIIYIIRKTESFKAFLIASITFVFGALAVAVFDKGDGIYAHSFYSKQEREQWRASDALQVKIHTMTHAYRVYCPEDSKFWTMTATEKADWHAFWGKERNLQLLPGSELCYIYRK